MLDWRLGLIAAWVLLISIGAWLGLVRHSLFGFILMFLGFVCQFVHTGLDRRDRVTEETARSLWISQVRELADDIHLEGYGIESLEDLSRYHDAAGRAEVLASLRSLPVGQRHLLAAARAVDPDAEWD